MSEHLSNFLASFMSPVGVTFVLSMLPISELRGALLYALTIGDVPFKTAYPLAVIGNMIPIIPVVFFLGPASNMLRKFSWGDRLVEWVFARARSRSDKIRMYETWGLVLFVAIPLPVTGAWTGSVAAFLCGIRKPAALVAILAGVLIAGLVVSAFTVGVTETFSALFG
ncbi:COG2426 family protein [Candidatus Hydrogenedentota bacterium]